MVRSRQGLPRKNTEEEGEEVEEPIHLSPDVSDVEDDSDKSEFVAEENNAGSKQKAREHMQQLERLRKKDPEFYDFLKQHDKDLLEFNDADIPDDSEADVEDTESQDTQLDVQETSTNIITSTMVDSWCNKIRENQSVGAVRSLLRAFRTACHAGDDGEKTNFHIISSSVFNKLMLFVLNEMDGILRGMLKLPSAGGNKEMITCLMSTKAWTNYGSLVKSYLGNLLHVLNQMTDNQMVAYTLRKVKNSVIFLAAFRNLARKYIKVALHFWGMGGGALPVASFLFLRDLCVQIGSDCIDSCLKGIYKYYVLNCQFVSASKLQHIQFLANCVTELYGVDLPSAYQHSFVYIRQLATILRDALTVKTKESFRKVYEWKFMNCLELWTRVICAYNSEADFKPLAYPLAQIISGVARLVPTARYFPLRLRCARMLNRIAAATNTFIPVSMLLLDMLEMKELNRPLTGGVGKALDLQITLKVSKPTLKTRGFQEACMFSFAEELAEHLSQWSYSVAFFELSFIPLVRLRNFCKSTKVERFRREVKELVRKTEASSEFTNTRRMTIGFSPNDRAVSSFLVAEKESKASPLSQYVAMLRANARRRKDSMVESSVLVGEKSSTFSKNIANLDEEAIEEHTDRGAAIFSSSWLPGQDSKNKGETKPKRSKKPKSDFSPDEDVVEDLVLSSDEDEEGRPVSNSSPIKKETLVKFASAMGENKGKKRKQWRKQKMSKQNHTKKPRKA